MQSPMPYILEGQIAFYNNSLMQIWNPTLFVEEYGQQGGAGSGGDRVNRELRVIVMLV